MAGEFYSAAEDETLRRLTAENKSRGTIAFELNRSERSIKTRQERLGLEHKRAKKNRKIDR